MIGCRYGCSRKAVAKSVWLLTRSGSSLPIANSRRMTSCSFTNSSGGSVEFITASASKSRATGTPFAGMSIQYTVRSKDV